MSKSVAVLRCFRGQIVARRSHGRLLSFVTLNLDTPPTNLNAGSESDLPANSSTTTDQGKTNNLVCLCFNQYCFIHPPRGPGAVNSRTLSQQTIDFANQYHPVVVGEQATTSENGNQHNEEQHAVAELPFPQKKNDLHLGDRVECVCVFDPPPAASTPTTVGNNSDGDNTSENHNENDDLGSDQNKGLCANWSVVRWFRIGERYAGTCLEFAHQRGGPVGAYTGEFNRIRGVRETNTFKKMVEFHHSSVEALRELPSNDARFHEMARRVLERSRAKTHVCPRCWLLRSQCMCHAMSKPLPRHTNHRFFVLMHYKEVRRTSNTGKILLAGDTTAQLLVFGEPEADDKIQELARRSNTAVLFPSPDSVAVPDFLAEFRISSPREAAKGGDDTPQDEIPLCENIEQKQAFAPVEPPGINIIVLDGTWNQARTMNRHCPAHLKRIALAPNTVSLFVIRQQTQPDRICTIEAITMLMQELGEPTETTEELVRLLKVHVNHCKRQSSADAVIYDNV